MAPYYSSDSFSRRISFLARPPGPRRPASWSAPSDGTARPEVPDKGIFRPLMEARKLLAEVPEETEIVLKETVPTMKAFTELVCNVAVNGMVEDARSSAAGQLLTAVGLGFVFPMARFFMKAECLSGDFSKYADYYVKSLEKLLSVDPKRVNILGPAGLGKTYFIQR